MIKTPGVDGGRIMTRPGQLLGVDGVGAVGDAGDSMRGRMCVDHRHRGVDGRTAVGALGVLADEVLGFSIIASLPPGSWTVSTEIWLDVLRPLPLEGRLTAEARTLSVGSFAVGRMFDADGLLLAECRERGRQIDDVPDRTTPAQALPGRVRSSDGGLANLLGLTFDGAPQLQVTPALENPRRMLHGGISLAACELIATWSRIQAGSSLSTTSVHVVHTRAAPYGSVVHFELRTLHAGKSLWVTEEAGTVGGKVCVTARISAQ